MNFAKSTGLAFAGLALILAACGEKNLENQPTIVPAPSSPTVPGGDGTGSGAAPGSREEFLQIGDRVWFDVDRYDLSSDAQATLEKQAAWLKTWPAVTVTIEGHADERGTREYNLALGDRRAAAIANYLVALGIDPTRLATVSFGKERPAVDGHDETAWAQNRRGVTIPILP